MLGISKPPCKNSRKFSSLPLSVNLCSRRLRHHLPRAQCNAYLFLSLIWLLYIYPFIQLPWLESCSLHSSDSGEHSAPSEQQENEPFLMEQKRCVSTAVHKFLKVHTLCCYLVGSKNYCPFSSSAILSFSKS